MRWFSVDGARAYLNGLDPAAGATLDRRAKPSRKAVYLMVADGLRVARLGDSGRRLMFSDRWIDEFLERKAGGDTAFSKRGAA